MVVWNPCPFVLCNFHRSKALGRQGTYRFSFTIIYRFALVQIGIDCVTILYIPYFTNFPFVVIVNRP